MHKVALPQVLSAGSSSLPSSCTAAPSTCNQKWPSPHLHACVPQEHKRTPRAELPAQQLKAGGLIKHIMHHQLLAEEGGALSTTNVGQHAAQQFLGQSAAHLLQVRSWLPSPRAVWCAAGASSVASWGPSRTPPLPPQ
jgi:hypothetical protein